MRTVGIDIGGTTVSIGIVDNNEIIKIKTIENCYIGKPDELVGRIIEVITELEDIENISFIGIGCPGRVEASIIYNAVNLQYDEFPIARYMEEKTGIKCLAENDATAALIGEMTCGSLVNVQNGILLTLGTGVGGGICINGKAYKGSTSSAGELGHVVYIRNGYQCKCGKKGCFEQYASTSALLREIKLNINDNKESILYEYCEGNLDNINGLLFFKAVQNQDKFAEDVLDKFTGFIADGICDFVNILDSEIVAVGGGISEAGPLLLEPIAGKLESRGFKIKVVKAALGNQAGILGAANLQAV